MYEHPIKRAGLSLNRIIYSNTKMVAAGFPSTDGVNRFALSFKYRTFAAGKATETRCKLPLDVVNVYCKSRFH